MDDVISAQLIVELVLSAHQCGILDGLTVAEKLPLSGGGNAGDLRDSIKREIERRVDARKTVKP